jgi:ATP-dependent RNA helicase DeaD
VEQDAKDLGGVSRSQNVVYVVPHDWASISFFLAPLIERVDETAPQLQLLVITADAESAAAVAGAAVRLATTKKIGIVAATALARATRLIRLLPSQVIIGTPATVVELVRGSTLKLETVKAIAFAWADAILADPGAEEMIGTLMADIPKDAARSVAAAEMTPAVESLIERYARRARRVMASASTDTTPMSLEYFTASESGRLIALRRILDAVDPENAVVFVREADAAKAVSDLLRSLGYSGPDAPVRVSHGGGAPETVILFDLPASREELAEAMGAAAKRTIAFIQPRQLSSLRALAAGGRVRPITLPDAGLRTRNRDELIRAELRTTLERGTIGRTLLAIEPLLEEYDGVEIAAAAIELLEQERAKARATLDAHSASRPRDGMVRLFLSAGARDGLRTGDVLASIGSEAGIPGTEIGKIEIRDSHTIVEVAPGSAAVIVEKLTGKTISGRRAIVRPDQDAGERPSSGTRGREGGAKREGGSRPSSRGSFSGERHPPRDGPRGRPSTTGRDRPRPDRPRTGGKGS